MISYDLAKQLKDAGFYREIQIGDAYWLEKEYKDGHLYHFGADGPDVLPEGEYIRIPTLSELIEACGDWFFRLERIDQGKNEGRWIAVGDRRGDGTREFGFMAKNPETATAKLLIALKKK